MAMRHGNGGKTAVTDKVVLQALRSILRAQQALAYGNRGQCSAIVNDALRAIEPLLGIEPKARADHRHLAKQPYDPCQHVALSGASPEPQPDKPYGYGQPMRKAQMQKMPSEGNGEF
jgi:hypothetical protein